MFQVNQYDFPDIEVGTVWDGAEKRCGAVFPRDDDISCCLVAGHTVGNGHVAVGNSHVIAVWDQRYTGEPMPLAGPGEDAFLVDGLRLAVEPWWAEYYLRPSDGCGRRFYGPRADGAGRASVYRCESHHCAGSAHSFYSGGRWTAVFSPAYIQRTGEEMIRRNTGGEEEDVPSTVTSSGIKVELFESTLDA